MFPSLSVISKTPTMLVSSIVNVRNFSDAPIIFVLCFNSPEIAFTFFVSLYYAGYPLAILSILTSVGFKELEKAKSILSFIINLGSPNVVARNLVLGCTTSA